MIRPSRSPGLSVPFRYLLAGLLAWILLGAGIPLLALHLTAGYDDPQVFALTHLAVLGWVTMTIMGATYQLFPVALQARLAYPALARLNFFIYAGALAGFVPSFYFSWTPGVATFGTLAVVGVTVYVVNLGMSFPSIAAWHPMASYVLSGLGWLLVTLGFGLAWALDWQTHWFAITPNMLAAHVHAGLVGWLGTTFIGVSYKLMELFALAHRRSWRLAHLNLALWNLGLAGLVLSLLLIPGTWVVTGFASWLGLSVALFCLDLTRMWRGRRRRTISLEQGYLALSLASMVVAAALGILITRPAGVGPNVAVAYGYCAVVGCFGSAIIGKYFKIIPFLTWLDRYGRHPSAGPAPLLRDLVDERRGWAALFLIALGLAGVVSGLLAAVPWVVVAAGLVYLLGALVDAGTLARVLIPGRRVVRSTATAGAGADRN
ncbi:MAG: hypothetical protein ACREN7_01205 [Candidatus Dormibacteria bacterium]